MVYWIFSDLISILRFLQRFWLWVGGWLKKESSFGIELEMVLGALLISMNSLQPFLQSKGKNLRWEFLFKVVGRCKFNFFLTRIFLSKNRLHIRNLHTQKRWFDFSKVKKSLISVSGITLAILDYSSKFSSRFRGNIRETNVYYFRIENFHFQLFWVRDRIIGSNYKP